MSGMFEAIPVQYMYKLGMFYRLPSLNKSVNERRDEGLKCIFLSTGDTIATQETKCWVIRDRTGER